MVDEGEGNLPHFWVLHEVLRKIGKIRVSSIPRIGQKFLLFRFAMTSVWHNWLWNIASYRLLAPLCLKLTRTWVHCGSMAFLSWKLSFPDFVSCIHFLLENDRQLSKSRSETIRILGLWHRQSWETKDMRHCSALQSRSDEGKFKFLWVGIGKWCAPLFIL